MNLSLTLQAVARRLPDHPAITDSRGTIDYATFEQRVAAMAGGLRAFVPTPGARVAIAMENAPEFLISLYALWRAGRLSRTSRRVPDRVTTISASGLCPAAAPPDPSSTVTIAIPTLRTKVTIVSRRVSGSSARSGQCDCRAEPVARSVGGGPQDA